MLDRANIDQIFSDERVPIAMKLPVHRQHPLIQRLRYVIVADVEVRVRQFEQGRRQLGWIGSDTGL